MTKQGELVLLELKQVTKTLDEHSKVLADVSKESVRTGERTKDIWRVTQEQEAHLKKQNSHLDDHSHRLVVVETKVDERTLPPVVEHKMNKKTKVGYGGGTVVVVATLVLAIGQTLGWW